MNFLCSSCTTFVFLGTTVRGVVRTECLVSPPAGDLRLRHHKHNSPFGTFPQATTTALRLPCHHTTILFLSCSWTLSIVTARGVPPSIILSQQPSLDSCVLFLPLVLLGSAFSVVVIGCNLAACRSSTHSFFGNLWTPYNHRVSQIFLFV